MGKHLRNRTDEVLAAAEGSDDDLLNTQQMTNWLQVSRQWLEIGRSRGYGPPFVRLSPSLVRYRRGAVRRWLEQQSYRSTAEYRDQDAENVVELAR